VKVSSILKLNFTNNAITANFTGFAQFLGSFLAVTF